jgi:hypothetical protein
MLPSSTCVTYLHAMRLTHYIKQTVRRLDKSCSEIGLFCSVACGRFRGRSLLRPQSFACGDIITERPTVRGFDSDLGHLMFLLFCPQPHYFRHDSRSSVILSSRAQHICKHETRFTPGSPTEPTQNYCEFAR